MAKSAITDVNSTNTFQVWLDKTNELVNLVRNDIVTTSLDTPAGDITIGNATIQGIFTSNTLIADTLLRADTISPIIGSTIIEFTAPTIISTNQTVLSTLSSTIGPRLAFTDNSATWQVGFENITTKSFTIASVSTGNSFKLSSDGNAVLSGTLTASGFVGNLSGAVTGNASSAAILQTARTINGTAFNGSANITTTSWGTPRTITIGNTAKSVNGSANTAWSIAEIGAVPTTRTFNNGTGLTGFGDLSVNRTPALTGQALAFHNLATDGLVTRTSASTIVARSIAGTTDQISVTNGSGVSGNPTISAVIASQIEAEQGVNTVKLMTAQRTAQAIANQVNTAKVLGETADLSVGAVGSYAFLYRLTAGSITPGSTYAATDLRYAGLVSAGSPTDNTAISYSPVALPAGSTWRAVGGTDFGTRNAATLFVRIS